MRSTPSPERSCGPAVIRSRSGIIGAAFPWRTDTSTLGPSMACSIASAFRSSVMLALAMTAVHAQEADRVKVLERTLRDYGGLIRYGSDNSELPAPKPGEN